MLDRLNTMRYVVSKRESIMIKLIKIINDVKKIINKYKIYLYILSALYNFIWTILAFIFNQGFFFIFSYVFVIFAVTQVMALKNGEE